MIAAAVRVRGGGYGAVRLALKGRQRQQLRPGGERKRGSGGLRPAVRAGRWSSMVVDLSRFCLSVLASEHSVVGSL